MATLATEEAVAQAAEDLVANGIEPTVDRIRQQIGGGSYSTISERLREWKAANARRLQVAIEMPAEIDAKAKEFVQTMWFAAVNETRKQADAEREIASADRSRLLAELAEAHAEIKRLEATGKRQDDQLLELQRHVADCDIRVALAEQKYVSEQSKSLEIQADLQEARRTLLERAERVGHLEAEVAALRREATKGKPGAKAELEQSGSVRLGPD